MPIFRRILVAYNDSPSARRALETGVALAREQGAELVAVAVGRSLPLPGQSIADVRDLHAARERACAGWLSAALAYADGRGVPLATEIRIGLVSRQVADAATGYQADLLVVGRGRTGIFWHRLAGRVSRRAPCRTLIVP
jgi:nucleotide-binding universal stress UspA family protein